MTVMRILYFDCFSGVSQDKILGALIDCFTSFDLGEVIEKVSSGRAALVEKETVVGGIPGTLAFVECEETCPDKVADGIFFEDEKSKKAIEITLEMAKLIPNITLKSIYTVFGVVYILSKVQKNRTITSCVYDGMGSGNEDTAMLKDITQILRNFDIQYSITDSHYVLSDKTGASLLGMICDGCGALGEADIIKIGYGLGKEQDGVSDALRLVVAMEREKDIADIFEASLEIGMYEKVSVTYSEKER